MANITNVVAVDRGLTFYFDDATTCCLPEVKGTSITGIEKLNGLAPTSGTTDTYIVHLENGNDGYFQVVNGCDSCITGIVDNNDGTYTWNFNTSDSFTTGNLKGADGIGIESITYVNETADSSVLRITTTDNTIVDHLVCNGKSPTLTEFYSNAGHCYTMKFSDGVVATTGCLKGPPGTSLYCMYPTSVTLAQGGISCYTPMYTDGTSGDMVCVKNGNGITNISRTSGTGAVGTVDTYTINTSIGDYTFDVTHGTGIQSINKVVCPEVIDKDFYSINLTDNTSSTFEIAQGIGVCKVSCVAEYVSGLHTYNTYKMEFSRGLAPFTWTVKQPLDGGKVTTVYCTGNVNVCDIHRMVFDNGYSYDFCVKNSVYPTGATSSPIADPGSGREIAVRTNIFLNDGTKNTFDIYHGKPLSVTSKYCNNGIYEWTFTDGAMSTPYKYLTSDLRGSIIDRVYFLCKVGNIRTYQLCYCNHTNTGSNCFTVCDGIDPYEIAVANGYIGDETSFNAALGNISTVISCVDKTEVSLIPQMNTLYNNISACTLAVSDMYEDILSAKTCTISACNSAFESSTCAANYAISMVPHGTYNEYSAKYYYVETCNLANAVYTTINSCVTSARSTINSLCNSSLSAINECTACGISSLNTCILNGTVCLAECIAIEITNLTNGAGTACMWAETPHNVIICTNNGVDSYSALHWAVEANQAYEDTNAAIAAVDSQLACATTLVSTIDEYATTIGNVQSAISASCTFIVDACCNIATMCSDIKSACNTILNSNSNTTAAVNLLNEKVSVIEDGFSTIGTYVDFVAAASTVVGNCLTCVCILSQSVKDNSACVCNALVNTYFTTFTDGTVRFTNGFTNETTTLRICSNICDLNDVLLTAPVQGDILVYNADSCTWNNTPNVVGTCTRVHDFNGSLEEHIIHNLNRYPSVTITDIDGNCILTQVTQNNLNCFTVYFSNSTSGRIYYV